VLAYLDFLGVAVDTVLDAGCGPGMWRDALTMLKADVDYTGIETSEYLCGRYGWRQAAASSFTSRRKFDLIICQDVLQYVDNEEARRSIGNIARLCRGALYFDVPTREDMKNGSLDRARTDRQIHLRSARWYKRLLTPYFHAAGGGVFIPREGLTVLLALERV
jgi:SAM-dependent methyltransferase